MTATTGAGAGSGAGAGAGAGAGSAACGATLISAGAGAGAGCAWISAFSKLKLDWISAAAEAAGDGWVSLAATGRLDSEAWPAAPTPISRAHAAVNTAARRPRDGILASRDVAVAGAGASASASLRRP
ncbi:hypothetical protein EYS21_12725 [Arthrobacter sp. S39]|nr:hypothetical protein EYS21_12725 [Arthrobacter sp. S39]